MATEAKIERAVCKWAKEQGCIVVKMTSPGSRGIPDRLFMRKGKVLFLEFKAPGKKPTKLQDKWIRDLFLTEIPAFWIDDDGDAKRLIRDYLP